MNEAPLRLATARDIPALHTLAQSAYRGDAARAGWTHEADMVEGERISVAELAAILANADERLIVAAAGDALIGCVRVTNEGDGRAMLGLLAVDPATQAAGLGKRLIAGAEDIARRAFAATTMRMSVISRRTELIAYYERRGYARTGEEKPFFVVTDPPLTLQILAKPL